MTSEHATLRALTAEDYPAVLDLWRRSGLHTIRSAGRDSAEAFARQIAQGLLVPLGLEAEGRLVGVVLATHDGRKGWINRLAVDPEYRRLGCARRLVLAAEEALRGAGIHVMAALVEGENAPSLALFQDLDYVEIDPRIHYLSKRDRDSD
jgi:N-acetylglutamate synthase